MTSSRRDLGEYLSDKFKRQREDERESSERLSDIFKECVVYINGLTNPSNDDLQRLIRIHGGDNTSQRSEQTHFLCNNFTNQQVLAKMKRSKPEKFFHVTQEWVLRSVEAKKRLPEWQFMPPELKDVPICAANNPLLKQFLHPDGSSSSSSSSSSSPPKKGGRALDAEKQPVEFLASYLSNSRLHFIGTYRDRVYEVRREMLREGTLSSSGSNCSSSSGGGGGRGSSVPAFLQADTGRGSRRERVVLHADIDCFFVQAAVRGKPELQEDLHEGKVVPLCVAHSSGSSSEISSCNYSARQCGVSNGMWMKTALEKCPALQVIDYDFPAYESVSRAVLRVLFSFPRTVAVAPISCDEAYLELEPGTDGVTAARSLRQQIFDLTACKVSVGVGSNMLQARIATKSAKPPHGEGVFFLDSASAQEHLADLNVGVLPGVGPKACKMLQGLGLSTCRDLQQFSKDELARQLPGDKKNQAGALFDMCRGRDDRIPALEPIQSIGIECNWGVRFTSLELAVRFLGVLCDELVKRMERTGVRGFSACTVKVSIRHPDAATETTKFLGCGHCIDKSKLASSRDSHGPDTDSIRALVFPLFRGLMSEVPVADLRGVSIQLGALKGESSSEGHVSRGKQSRLEDMFLPNSPSKRDCSSSSVLSVASESVSNQPPVKKSRRRRHNDDGDDDDDDDKGKAAPSILPPAPINIQRQVAPSKSKQKKQGQSNEVKAKRVQQQPKIEDGFRVQECHPISGLNLSREEILNDRKAQQQLLRNSVASNSFEPGRGRKHQKVDSANFIDLSRSEVIDLSRSQNDAVPVQSHGQGWDMPAEAEAPGPTTGWQLRDGLFFYSDLELHVRAWVTQWQHDYDEQSTQESENESDPAACALEDLMQELRAQALDFMRRRPDVAEAVLKAMYYCGKRVEPARLCALWAEAEGVVKEDVQRAFAAAHGAPLLLHWMQRGMLR